MLYNYRFSFKKVNGLNILFYCFISIFFLNFCFCTTYDGYLSELVDEKTAFIDNEEIIRRRSVAESYLKEIADTQKDWIKPYHTSFVENSAFTSRKVNQEGVLENEDKIHVTPPLLYPFQNVDFSSLKNAKDPVNPYESSYKDMISDNPKDSPKSFKTAPDNILPQSVVTDNNVNGAKQPLKSCYNQMCNSNVSKVKTKSNNLEINKSRKRQADSKSKSKKLNNLRTYHEIATKNIEGISYVYSNDKEYNMCSVYNKNNTSYSKIKHSSTIKNHDFQLDKYIEIVLMNSEFIVEKYFINSASLTLTEVKKLQRNLARLSFLQRSKNSVYSVNRMNIIDSMGKLTPLSKQNEFIEEKPQPLTEFSFLNEEISTESMQDNVNALKKSTTDFRKRVSHKLNHDKNTAHSSNLEYTSNNKFVSSNRFETDKNDFSHNSEILRRKKLMNSFITTLNNNQKNWVKTYDFINLNSEPEENVLPTSINDNFKKIKSGYNLHKTSEQPKDFSKVNFQERSYIIRWINKLNNKAKDSQCSSCSHNILVSGDSFKILGKLSQEFDIVLFDELVNNIISSATINNNIENMFYFYYENTLNAISLFLSYRIICIITILLFSCFLFCSLFPNTGQNFTLYRIILTFSKHYKGIILITLLSFSIFLHGNKMYQQKIAEKHKVMSRVVPSYCESILNQESGIVAHFKEYVRWWWHDEDCKKYYEAVMVDPSLEISPLSISTELFSDAIFQMLQPFGRNMNSFFRTLTNDLSFIQKIFIPIFAIIVLIVILCFCLLTLAFRWNFKVYLPFHLGSVEPTEFSVGSGVQEVEEKESSHLKGLSTSDSALQEKVQKSEEKESSHSKDFSTSHSALQTVEEEEISFLKDFNNSHRTLQITYKNKTGEKDYVEDIILKENTFTIESKHFKSDSSKYCVLKFSRTRHNSV